MIVRLLFHPRKAVIEMALQRLQQPTTEPVTLTELKSQLRMETTYTDEDTHLTRILTAARQFCEEICDRSLGEQKWRLLLDDWPADDGPIKLERPPIKSVDKVGYIGSDGVQRVLIENVDYLVSLPQRRIVPAYGKAWPSVILRPIDAIQIEYTAGAEVLETEKQAILLAATWLYAHRGDDPHDMDAATMRAIKALIGQGVPFA